MVGSYKICYCSWCSKLLCRYDAVRKDGNDWIHVSCQREREYLEGMKKLREEKPPDIGGMP